MPNGPVAIGASCLALKGAFMTLYIVHKGRVAFHTIFLKIHQVRVRDPYGLRKILQRKSFGMVPSIECFGDIFLWECMRDMAIVAGGRLMVACFDPGIIMIRHNVTIHAGFWVIANIRESLGIAKCVDSASNQNTQRQTNSPIRPFHLVDCLPRISKSSITSNACFFSSETSLSSSWMMA